MPNQHASMTTPTKPAGGRIARAPRAKAAICAATFSVSALLGIPVPAAAAPQPAAITPAAQDARPIAVTVRAADHRLDLPKRHFVPGNYAITVVNAGSEPHALVVDGPEPGHVATPVLRPGESAQLRIYLREGSHEFYCPLGTHQQQGMRVAVTVS